MCSDNTMPNVEMTCARIQAALSARLDGEPPGLADELVDAHLAECSECQHFLREAARLKRQLGLCTVAPSISDNGPHPELFSMIIEGVEPARRRYARRRMLSIAVARLVLVVIGIIYILWSVHLVGEAAVPPAASYDEGTSATMYTEAAAIRAALGFGLFFSAWRSSTAFGVLPIYGALFFFSLGLNMNALILGTTSTSTAHWLVLTGLSTCVLLAYWLVDRGLASLIGVWQGLSSHPVHKR